MFGDQSLVSPQQILINEGSQFEKLKMKESPGEYKLAIYYSPLAVKLNQEQLEQIPADALGSTLSEKGKPVKSAPLLESQEK